MHDFWWGHLGAPRIFLCVCGGGAVAMLLLDWIIQICPNFLLLGL